MKKVFLAMMLIGFVGCASNSRDVASAESSHCSLKKHPTKSWYKVQVHGKSYNKYWYSEKKANELMDSVVASGKCD
ncbi:hypothetical protein OAT67_02620 [Bacteriovoracaceae bacterium]|nr:hypothetical protein [Bacteriovoracaceae bacterium]|tara:strand:+ start:751 stop:978 length:228 start_codon:yes stop_codon:yes gene_type:complete